MRLDVLLGESTPAPSEVAGRVVVVIDVLRASTVMVQALANGAKAIVPFAEVEEVVAAAQRYSRDEVRLAGERRSLPIAGFDVGNSPQSMTDGLVGGRTVLMTTTNGTLALLSTHGAQTVYVAGFVNLSATVARVVARVRAGANVLVVCAGQDRRFALEDAACAGALVQEVARARRGLVLGDAARVARQLAGRYAANAGRLTRDAQHAQALVDAGFADDVQYCLTRDSIPLVVTYADRQVSRERILPAA